MCPDLIHTVYRAVYQGEPFRPCCSDGCTWPAVSEFLAKADRKTRRPPRSREHLLRTLGEWKLSP